MTPYKLTANGTTSLDGAASLDIIENGRIVGIVAIITGIGGTSGFELIEISTSSSSGFTANDTRSSIFQSGAAYGTGAFQSTVTIPCDIPVKQGDRLFLHQLITGAISTQRITVYLHVADGQAGRRSRL